MCEAKSYSQVLTMLTWALLAQIVKPFAQEAADKAVPAAKELSEGAQLMLSHAHTCIPVLWLRNK